jgi:lipid II:glycine glycyltransferase (peptidoglycan interpeptide bridge formation enzyme)
MENSQNTEIAEDLRQAEVYGKHMEDIGWKTVKIQGPRSEIQVFIRKLGPVGIAKIQRVNLPLPWENVNEVLTKEKVMMCVAEPLSGDVKELLKHGFRVNKEPMIGSKTSRISLKPEEEVILNSFKKDARYEIRKCKMKNVQCKIDDFKLFYEIWKKSAKRKKLWIPSENDYYSLIERFGKDAFCVTADSDAGAVVLINKKTAFYYYAGGTSEGTKLNLPYLVVWTAMIEAKYRGCFVWDFEGIYDPRWPNKSWSGFTHFKKSFNGTEIDFPGSFIKWQWPF